MRRLAAVAVAISLAVVGCGGGSDDSDSTADPSTSASTSPSSADTGSGSGDDGYGDEGGSTGGGESVTGTITISGFAYGAPLTVAPGALVTVVNQDPQEHSATAEDGSFDTGLFGQGEQMTFTAPATAGTYNITCTAHSDMAGQLIVAA